MSQPLFGTQGKARVDKLLSQISIRYSNEALLADQIMPIVNVKERTGLIPKYGKDNLRVFGGGLIRKPGTRAKNVEFTYAQGQYVCQERSVEASVPFEAYKNTDDPYDPARDTTMHLKDLIQQDREYAISQLMNNGSIFTNGVTLTGADCWDQAGSDPITDLTEGVKQIQNKTGRSPNVLILANDSLWTLKTNAAVREYLKYTNGGQLSNTQLFEALKDLLGVTTVLIGKGIYNAAAEGQDDDIQPFWTSLAVLLYRPDRPGLMEPALGYTFCDVPDVVDGWGEIWNKRDMLRDTMSFEQNVIDVDLSYVIKGTQTA